MLSALRNFRLGGTILAALALALGASVASCNRAKEKALKESKEKEAAMEREVAPSRRALNVGETVVFEFDCDKVWHPAPYAAYNGQHLRIVPHGESVNLGKGVITFRVEKMAQLVSDRTEFTVTNPGRIYFRLDPAKVPGFAGRASVEITRLK